METFLKQLAKHITENHHENTAGLAVVLPSRRAVAYLKKELPKHTSSVMWMPDIFSVEDFIFEASGFEPVDPSALLIELFRIHQQISSEDKASLDKFLSWAPMMVQDFNAIDENLADASRLFDFLSEAKALEKWRPDKDQLTDNEKQYVSFFRTLNTYYQKLRDSLLKQRKAYNGMAIRAVYESKILLDHHKWQHFIFAGFYAHNECEEKLLKALKKEGKLTQFYDADRFYTENPFHEAGKFLREKAKSRDFKWLGNAYKEKHGEINICGVPGNIGQARQAGEILESLISGSEGKDKTLTEEKTAVVLADESLLLPVLNSLPDNIKGINVTMGFPVKYSSTASLIKMILKAALNKQRFNRELTHIEELLQLISLPVTHSLLAEHHTIREQMLTRKRVFYNPDEVKALLPEPLASLMGKTTGPAELLELMIDLTASLYDTTGQQESMKIENHSAALICDRLIEVKNILAQTNTLDSVNDLEKLLQKTVLNACLPFSGEPLKGIQIMGMLESRALDFENIILLSVNEGALPSSKAFNSLISFDIRRKFGLPTYRDNDSIYAYHFYRLLQRAKNVELLYNTEAGTLGSNDQSRFIRQIRHELKDYNSNITISHNLLTPPAALTETRNISIEKTPEVLSDLKTALRKENNGGLSASGLKKLNNCSLQYYFHYILKLKTTEPVEETIPMHVFGNAVHEVLEDIYRPEQESAGKKVEPEYLQQMKKQVREYVITHLPPEYSGEMMDHGRNKLMVDLAEKLINRFLDAEKETARNHALIIKSVEEKLTHTETIEGYEVHFHGNADRIDMLDGNTRVIDYKTGNVNPYALSQNTDFNRMDELKTGEAIQVLFYDWIYSKMKSSPEARQGGIMLLANPGKNSIFFKKGKETGISPEIREQFEEVLYKQVRELLDENIPFTQTEDDKVCVYCDFNYICNR
ncbi:MAG: PD-(D/E)XK nuclease family protein [Bacteroidales bacterium]